MKQLKHSKRTRRINDKEDRNWKIRKKEKLRKEKKRSLPLIQSQTIIFR
jgi:hypothetical protein